MTAYINIDTRSDMIKINGIEANILNEETEKINSTPSINEILDRMENNFVARNSISKNTPAQNVNIQNFVAEQNQSENNFEDSNLIWTLLPMLIGGKQKLDANFLIQQIIKKSNNPTLSKILQILPKLTSSQKSKDENKKVEKEEVKIDSLVRTDEVQNDIVEEKEDNTNQN